MSQRYRPLVLSFEDIAPPDDMHGLLNSHQLLHVRLVPDLPGTTQHRVPWGECIGIGYPAASFDRHFQPLEDVTGTGNVVSAILHRIMVARGISTIWFHEAEMWNLIHASARNLREVSVHFCSTELKLEEARPRWPGTLPEAADLWAAISRFQ